jgi:dTDP-4-dehydrorhamnose reductase
MRVLVTGAEGLLGRASVSELTGHHEVTPTTLQSLDIRDHRAVEAVVATVKPHAIVNCAAYTDVDGSEDHPVEALEVNALAVRSLAAAAARHEAIFVHYSTDFVFDGLADRPYVEEDRPNPRSTYACSKLIGEWLATEAARHYVLRVESLFGAVRQPGEAPRTSVDRIVESIAEGRPVRVFTDRTVSPSYVVDVAAATRALLERGAPPGIYHCVNSGACTWADLAREVARQLAADAAIVPVSMADVGLRAERPRFCALSNRKLGEAGFPMRTWQEALAHYLSGRLL